MLNNVFRVQTSRYDSLTLGPKICQKQHDPQDSSHDPSNDSRTTTGIVRQYLASLSNYTKIHP